MKPLTIVFGCVGAILLVVAACDDEVKACNVDTDCPQGLICRNTVCGSVTADAGSALDAAPPPVVEDSSVPVIPTPVCRQLYELCINDCCPPLTCMAGSCR